MQENQVCVDVENNQYSIICEEDIQQMDEYIAQYYPDTIAEEEYNTINNTRPDIQNRLEYIMMKINEYKRDTKIRETLDKLVLVSHGLSDIPRTYQSVSTNYTICELIQFIIRFK